MTTTRRDLVQGATLSAGLGVLGVLPDGARAQQTAASAGTPTIESLTIKRRGTGFRGLDRARAFPGFTLFAPTGNTNKIVYLIDLEGHVVHSWTMPYPPGLYAYLTDRGTLL